MNKIKIIEWVGSITGVLGAIILSLNLPFSGWAYVSYLLSSILLIYWGLKVKAKGLALQQLIFTVVNIIGIYNWLIK